MTDFTLRPWRKGDEDALARYADNPNIAANLRDVFPWPYSRQDAVDFVAGCVQNEGRGQLCRAIEMDGEAVGSISLTCTAAARSWAIFWGSPSGAAGL